MNLSVASLFSVKGKVCLVTGGGSGIGKMMAATLVQNGAKVYIASRKLQQLQEACNELNGMAKDGGSAHYIVSNLSGKGDCDQLIAELSTRETRLHILVNNAGMSWGAPLLEFPEKEGWDRLMGLNVKVPYYLTCAAVPLLEKAAQKSIDPARVIMVSSVAGSSVDMGGLGAAGSVTPSYNVSKAALDHLTRILASQLASKFITVNCIAPGVYPSKMTAFAFKTHGSEAFAQGQPMGRVGTPEDMGGLLLFLVSRAGSHVTAQVIKTDGGAHLQRIVAPLASPSKL